MARQRKLSPERKAFINSLIEHYNLKEASDVQDMLKDLLGDTMQGMLEAEMDEQLGYSKLFQETEKVNSNQRQLRRIRPIFQILKTKYYPCMPKE